MRSGGLTKYAIEVMEEQSKSHEIYHLYPGNIDLLNRRVRIKKKKFLKYNSIRHYEIVNSLPLPLFNGIKEPCSFMKCVEKKIYFDFLMSIKPEVIHVHSLMGIHKEFFESAKEIGIKIIYTTHDYFGICPTINLYNKQGNCKNYNNGLGCATCCACAYSTRKLYMTQTNIYPYLKKLKKLKKTTVKQENNIRILDTTLVHEKGNEYISLRNFYLNIFNLIDYFHFNSTLAEGIFRQYLPNIRGKVVSITNGSIKKQKFSKTRSNKIRIGYLGPRKEYKGFFVLMDAFKQLPIEKFELYLYGDTLKIEAPKNVYINGRYTSSELEAIFSNIDVIVVPSIWKETFGFVSLEALSYGVPVIISNNVGSKDIVSKDIGWIFQENELKDVLLSLNKDEILQKKKKLIEEYDFISLTTHVKQLIESFYN